MEKVDDPYLIFYQIFIQKEFYCSAFKPRPLQRQAESMNYSLFSWNFPFFPASAINKKAHTLYLELTMLS